MLFVWLMLQTATVAVVYAVASFYDGPALSALAIGGSLAVSYYAFFVFDPGLRAARQVLQWVTQQHIDAWRALTGERTIPRRREIATRLEALAGLVSVALEGIRASELPTFLINDGRTDEARALLERTEAIHPFMRAALLAGAALRETGEASLAAPVAATDTVAPNDRVAAEVQLAMLRATGAAAARGDWRAPLAAVRPRLGRKIELPFLAALRRRRRIRLVFAIAGLGLLFVAAMVALPVRQ